LPEPKSNAMIEVSYAPSTKVLLQFRQRFWEREGIKGGFTKTTDTIGQVHYPTRPSTEQVNPNERGVLVVYTWGTDALVLGAEDQMKFGQNSLAIIHALEQIQKIHHDSIPSPKDLFEYGEVEAWFSEPTQCGAFVYAMPTQPKMLELIKPVGPSLGSPEVLFFAGEGVSFTHGWIQGALESGLLAAFTLYCGL